MSDRVSRVPGPERRRMIIRSARRSFAEVGYFGASTASIAAGAGCSEAVLYRHFGSKIDLLLAVLRETAGAVLAMVAGLREPGDDPVDVLTRIAHRLHGTPEGADTIRIVTFAVSASREPGVRETLLSVFAEVRGVMTDLLLDGQATGAVRTDVAAGDIAWWWHGLIVAGAMRGSLDDGDDPATTGIGSAVEQLATLTRPQ